MGWLGKRIVAGKKTIDYVKEHVGPIVRYSTAEGVYYCAIRDEKTNTIYAAVVLTEKDKEAGEIRIKVIDEYMGPYYYNASARVLDALSETDNATALLWRAECRKRARDAEKLCAENIGVRFYLYNQEYRILGAYSARARSLQVRHETTGMIYCVSKRQLKEASVIE